VTTTASGRERFEVCEDKYQSRITLASDDDYYVSRNDYPQVFKLAQSDYEKITGLTADQLVKKINEKDKPSAAYNKQGTETDKKS